MSFWDTSFGQELAETLIRELPRLNRNSKVQYIVECDNVKEATLRLRGIFAKSEDKLVNLMTDPVTGSVTLILEKDGD